MNRTINTFQKAKQIDQPSSAEATAGKGVFMAGIVPGFPDLETSFDIAKTIIEAGADILELSASFSDPVADGPTLQQAHQEVLRQGITKAQIFQLYRRIRTSFPEVPLFVIEYANCVYHPGIENYYHKLSESGIDALLIPDLSLEEAAPYLQAAREHNIEQVFIVAPTTTEERLSRISQASTGFLYLVTITGVTGQREEFLQETTELIQRTKRTTNLPIVAGFGIGKPEHVKQAFQAGADGVVVCSAIINLIRQHKDDKPAMLKALGGYITSMKAAKA